ncbi:MAG: glycosyltransferase [Candidatus Adiutrix sp.]|jgi:spore maturation protein CgeB|nr:glycosyltransferase [Candidatus Adiutrix sp.]
MAEATRAGFRDEESKGLAALAAGGQDLALAWLKQAPATGPVTEALAATGQTVVVAGGQSQASRRDPEAEARAWLAEAAGPAGFMAGPAGSTDGRPAGPEPGRPLVIFGFGQPWAVRLLLESGRRVAVFEPDPLVALAVLNRHDFSSHLAAAPPQLRLLTPWHLADSKGLEDLPRPARADQFLVSPAARRRAPAQLAQLARRLGVGAAGIMAGGAPRTLRPAGPDLRLMVIPPLSGGPEPVAEALARAATGLGFTVLYLDWGAELKAREKAAQGPPSADRDRALAGLLELSGARAAEAVSGFRPDLAVALAQAPLTVPALDRMRDGHPETVLAFWLVEDFRLFPYALETGPAYDVFFHIQEGLIEPALRDIGLDRAHYLPLAADPDFFKPCPDLPPAFRAELSFMGAGYPNRVRLLEGLAARYQPREFKIYGSGWPRDGRLAEHLFEGGRRVTPRECALIYAGGRVNLNLHSSLKDEAVFDGSGRFLNPRAFEIAAAGGLQITDPRPLLPLLFTPGREVAVAETPQDLPDLIDHYLARPEEALALGRAARARVLAEHTYRHRLKRILACSGFQA